MTDASGQTITMTYNPRGQLLTVKDPKNQTLTFSYDSNGYLISTAGPLPGGNDLRSKSYDSFGRMRSVTDASGYTQTFDYDALDRLTKITYPDGTFGQYVFSRLDLTTIIDRAGRQTSLEFDNMRQVTKATDPLARVTRYEWCRCGAPKSVIDLMGRRTTWITDVQGRRTAKQFPDGSQVLYFYENNRSRVRQVVDERVQSRFYTYNPDDSLKSVSYGNSLVFTPAVSLTYDPNYRRVVSMTDGIGTTIYNYNPITSPPALGAGRLGGVDGPLPNDTVAYVYDELERVAHVTVDGVAETTGFDAASRITTVSNALGAFTYSYDGNSLRLAAMANPNGQIASWTYGTRAQDFSLNQVSYAIGATPVSFFGYDRDLSRGIITSWTQQSGVQPPSIYSFGYDAADQLLTAAVTNSGALVNSYAYSYDPLGNRLTEQAGGITAAASYNSLNQLTAISNSTVITRTNEWDAQNRLAAVVTGNQRTEFGYDGKSRLAYIRQLQNGSAVSFRRFVWCRGRLCEERDATGTTVIKRFFPQGVKFETGTNAGFYYYTRDHLGSVRELTDGSGNVRARYAYDPFGRRTKLGGDVDSDFAFAGMFSSSETSLSFAMNRVYDPNLARWLSRDSLNHAEFKEGPNLYAYVRNEPVDNTDNSGLGLDTYSSWCVKYPLACAQLTSAGAGGGEVFYRAVDQASKTVPGWEPFAAECAEELPAFQNAAQTLPSMDLATSFARTLPDITVPFQNVESMIGPEIEELLLEAGEIGGARFGANADRVLDQFNWFEQGYFDEFKDLLQIFNYERDYISFGDAARAAHQMAVNYFGYDPSTWLK